MSDPMQNDPRLLVHAYVDGELDPAHALELERQLARDPALAAERERIEALRQVIKDRLPPLPVPLALAAPDRCGRRIKPHAGTRVLCAAVLACARRLGDRSRWPCEQRNLV